MHEIGEPILFVDAAGPAGDDGVGECAVLSQLLQRASSSDQRPLCLRTVL